MLHALIRVKSEFRKYFIMIGTGTTISSKYCDVVYVEESAEMEEDENARSLYFRIVSFTGIDRSKDKDDIKCTNTAMQPLHE